MAFTKNRLYQKGSSDPFKISRTTIDNYLNCPRDFYLASVLGIKQPSGPAFTLNIAVDHLLKKEFDIHRAKGRCHPLLEAYGLNLVPFDHEMMDIWRSNFTGIQHHHEPTNFLVFGAPDDIWQDDKGKLYVVDYKATSKAEESKKAEDLWPGFLKQVEVYQWLLRQNGFDVSDTAYFVNCNGDKTAPAFDGKLNFNIKLIPYEGSDKWVEGTLLEMKKLLESGKIPDHKDGCEWCEYQKKIKEVK